MSKSASRTFIRVLCSWALLSFYVTPPAVAGADDGPYPTMTTKQGIIGHKAFASLGRHQAAVADWYGWTLPVLEQEFALSDVDAPSRLQLDDEGRLYWSETAGNARAPRVPPAQAQPFPNSETFRLHSKPGAPRTIVLNFAGATVTNTKWNTHGRPLVFSPFSLDANNRGWSAAEHGRIQRIWQSVAEDFAAFDVDVTTEVASEAALARTGPDDQEYGTTVIITSVTDGSCACRAVRVYQSSFADLDERRKPILIDARKLGNGNLQQVSSAISHALGHALGLRHDREPASGGSRLEQLTAERDGWAPIMGALTGGSITQFSKGDYPNARTAEDDYAVMADNGLPLRADDVGDSPDQSSPLHAGPSEAGPRKVTVSGIIERQADVDMYAFDAERGPLSVRVSPSGAFGNANLKLTLVRKDNAVVKLDDPAEGLGAGFDIILPQRGTYYLAVQGSGDGEKLSGRSSYGSRGAYKLTAQYFGKNPEPPVASFTVSQQTMPVNTTVQLDASASTDDDGTSSLTYRWSVGGREIIARNNSATATWTFSQPGDYTITLDVKDGYGLLGSTSQTVTVTAAPPSVGRPVEVFTAPLTMTRGTSKNNFTFTFGPFSGNAVGMYYEWDWGDGSGLTSTQTASASHTFTAPGNYTVSVTGVDTADRLHEGTLTVVAADTPDVPPPDVPPPDVPPPRSACVPGAWTVVSAYSAEQPVQYETTHFAFRWKDGDAKVADAVEAGTYMERVWDTFMGPLAFPEPYCDTPSKHKVNVNVDPTFGLNGGPTGLRDMGMWIGPLALKDGWGLAHEFAHGLQGSSLGLRESYFTGWFWESHADWMAHQVPELRNDTACSESVANFPHIYYGSTRNRYCNWLFFEHLKNKYGPAAVNGLWASALKPDQPDFREEDPFSALMRHQNWSISQLNDEFGDWALHNVTWDYVDKQGHDQGAIYRKSYGSYDEREGWRSLRVTRLEPMDLSRRRFAVPKAWAPQRWGYNLVRLMPDAGATTMTVKFRGVVQDAPATTSLPGFYNEPDSIPEPSSDWRWGVVAVQADGTPRYGPLMRGADGELPFDLRPDDKAVYLVVMGTPASHQKIKWDQPHYSLYRYPWMVELTGALPQGYEAGHVRGTDGRVHPNGGGWVSNAAQVDPSVYVGPHARVLGGTVTGNARIEDHALVVGGTISDNAVIGALSVIDNGVKVSGNARVMTTFLGVGAFEWGTELSGTVEIFGDAEVRGGPKLSRGVYSGVVTQDSANDPAQGSRLRTQVPEVTVNAPYVWRP